MAAKMRKEFTYWYPVNLRVSGKDLIQNHLTMFLYNHAAIWHDDDSKWPRRHLLQRSRAGQREKMSKSLGNFITLSQALDEYGTDATRLALADSGDSLDDANFVTETAKGFILKLTAFIDAAKDRMRDVDKLRTGPYNLFDEIFDNAINVAIQPKRRVLLRMQFRSALNAIFFEFIPGREPVQDRLRRDRDAPRRGCAVSGSLHVAADAAGASLL